MREFSFPFTEGLNKGLRSNSKNPRNSQYLTEAYNVKMGRAGAEPFVKLSQDIVSPDIEGYATPQLFATSAGNFLATKLGVYAIEHDLVISATSLVNGYWENDSVNWSLADFGQYQIWCDLQYLYYANPYNWSSGTFTMTGEADYPDGERNATGHIRVVTVAALGGRLFLTGYVDFYGAGIGPPYLASDYTTLDKVFWSRAGGMNYSAVDLSGNYAGDIARIIQLFCGVVPISSNALDKPGAGCVTLPFDGRVAALKPLGNKMMAYVGGSHYGYFAVYDETPIYSGQGGGVAALTQHVSPYPTFGVDTIRAVGVPRGRPVAGDDKRHVFIDSDGVLWTIDASMKLDRLGYEEFFYPRIVENNSYFYLSYDPVNEDYYICARGFQTPPLVASRTWILSKSGLSEIHQHVMSVAPMMKMVATPYSRTVQAICRTNGTDLSAYVCTDTLDMGTRAIKTITGLEIGATNSAAMVANVDYKYQTAGAFVTSTPKPVHKNGTVTPMVAGTDFRVRVKSTNFADFDMDYLDIRWKLNDKRLIRGLHESTVSKAVSGSGS